MQSPVSPIIVNSASTFVHAPEALYETGNPDEAVASTVKTSPITALAGALMVTVIVWSAIGTAVMSFGNSLASPGLTSLASKTADEHEQGRTLGVMQSAASLARAIGPMLGGVLLNNAMNRMDDATLYRTFWTASAIMFVAFLVAVYFAKNYRKANVIQRWN